MTLDQFIDDLKGDLNKIPVTTLNPGIKQELINKLNSIPNKIQSAKVFYEILKQTNLLLIHHWNEIDEEEPHVKQRISTYIGEILITNEEQLKFIIPMSIDHTTFNLRGAIDITSKFLCALFGYDPNRIKYPHYLTKELVDNRPTGCPFRSLWSREVGSEYWNHDGWYQVLSKIRNQGTHEDMENYGTLMTETSLASLIPIKCELYLHSHFFNPGFTDKELKTCYFQLLAEAESLIINSLSEISSTLRTNGYSFPIQ